MGAIGGKDAMQIWTELRVTNISKRKILLIACKLKKPKVMGQVSISDERNFIGDDGQSLIPPDASVQIRCLIWVQPPVREKNQEFVADLAILDQFGNEHWIKKIKFLYA